MQMQNHTMRDADNSQDNFPEYNSMVKFILEGVMTSCCCVFGFFANIICMFVMSRPTLKKGRSASVHAFLTSMAGVDIIVLISR